MEQKFKKILHNILLHIIINIGNGTYQFTDLISGDFLFKI